MAKCCHFWTFCKGYNKAKWLQNGRFWERSSDQPTRWLIRPHAKETGTNKWREHCRFWERGSDQPTRWLIRPHVKEPGTSKWRVHCNVFTWPYSIHFIPTYMVRTRVGGKLRMRKQNTKTTVPLDVVPERRTKRFPPRFRPVGRFCELRFRYLSSPTGREGEISRPLDQTDPIHPLSSTHKMYQNRYI